MIMSRLRQIGLLLVLAPLTLMAQEAMLHKQRAFPKTVSAGNYSGITWLGGSKYAIANDKSPMAGFYLMTIETDRVTGELLMVREDTFLTCGLPNRDDEGTLLLKGLNPQRLIITSILRTEEDVRALRRGNVNASENSTHRYATTFDIAYARYDPMDKVKGCVDSYPGQLKMVLAEVLRDLRNEGLCYVKHERRQPCFHITSRK